MTLMRIQNVFFNAFFSGGKESPAATTTTLVNAQKTLDQVYSLE